MHLFRTISHAVGLSFSLFLLMAASAPVAQAGVVTVTLQVSPATPTSGDWPVGGPVEIIVQALSNGASNQGFAGADFQSTSGWSLTVDPTKLQFVGADTWPYTEYTEYATMPPTVTSSKFQAQAIAKLLYGYELGVTPPGPPSNFLHLKFTVQPGLAVGESAQVAFFGQAMAYNVAKPDLSLNIFGTTTLYSDLGNQGSFLLTRTPEPATLSMILVGIGFALRARRMRAGRDA
jgi:hypothetical protein